MGRREQGEGEGGERGGVGVAGGCGGERGGGGKIAMKRFDNRAG